VLLSNSVAPMATSLYEGNSDVSGAGLRAYRFRHADPSTPARIAAGLVEELVVSKSSRRVGLGRSALSAAG
jgi:hypothetical protein